MERRNKQKQRNLACKCNTEVSFLVYVFLFFHGSLLGYKTQSVSYIFLHVEVAFIWSQLQPSGRHNQRQDVATPSRPPVWFVDSLLQRNIPMKSAKNAMRLMWWPPSETVEEDQCCGQSQVFGLHPAVCLSELPWWTPILSSVCLGRVFSPSWGKRGDRESEEEEERRAEEGGWEIEKGKNLSGVAWKKKKKMGGGGYQFAHRLRGLCVGPGVGLSGPLAFLCSLALKNKHTNTKETLREESFCVHYYVCFPHFHIHTQAQQQEMLLTINLQFPHTHTHTLFYPLHPSRHKIRELQAKQNT